MRDVVIIGIGWLGLELARQFVKRGVRVHGSVRHVDKAHHLANEGFFCCVMDFPLCAPQPQHAFPNNANWVVLIPPNAKCEYSQTLKPVVQLALEHRCEHLIFTSSTSVYPQAGTFTESSACDEKTPRGSRMCTAERIFMDAPFPKLTLLRLAGLIGPHRHPGRFWRQGQLTDANRPINLVHQDDCIGAILSALTKQSTPFEIFNVCAQQHPSRATFYQKARACLGLAPLEEINSEQAPKIIDGRLVTQQLGYLYKWPDLLYWLECADVNGHCV